MFLDEQHINLSIIKFRCYWWLLECPSSWGDTNYVFGWIWYLSSTNFRLSMMFLDEHHINSMNKFRCYWWLLDEYDVCHPDVKVLWMMFLDETWSLSSLHLSFVVFRTWYLSSRSLSCYMDDVFRWKWYSSSQTFEVLWMIFEMNLISIIQIFEMLWMMFLDGYEFSSSRYLRYYEWHF